MSIRPLLLRSIENGLVKFSTTMFQDGNNTGIEVTAEVVLALDAGKRPPVAVTVNGYEYRSTIAAMGGRYLIPFSAERRKESRLAGGDTLEVELAVDTAPRVVEVPADLGAALEASAAAQDAWAKLSYSQQKAHVRDGPPNSLFYAAGYHVRGDKAYYLKVLPGRAFVDGVTLAGADPATFPSGKAATGCSDNSITFAE
jgi:hypothetical protein